MNNNNNTFTKIYNNIYSKGGYKRRPKEGCASQPQLRNNYNSGKYRSTLNSINSQETPFKEYEFNIGSQNEWVKEMEEELEKRI